MAPLGSGACRGAIVVPAGCGLDSNGCFQPQSHLSLPVPSSWFGDAVPSPPSYSLGEKNLLTHTPSHRPWCQGAPCCVAERAPAAGKHCASDSMTNAYDLT